MHCSLHFERDLHLHFCIASQVINISQVLIEFAELSCIAFFGFVVQSQSCKVNRQNIQI